MDLPYFRIKWFKKGTCHLYFNRPDLVDELNRILVKHYPSRLKEATLTLGLKKNGHSNDTKTVISISSLLQSKSRTYSWTVPHHLVLEPSAGKGDLVKAISERGLATIHAIEKNPAHLLDLQRLNCAPKIADFLQIEPTQLYDFVVMNPPFSNGQDVEHALHAWEFLKPGGTLLAILSAGWTRSSRKHALRFQAFCRLYSATIEDLPPGAFKESGTIVRAVMVRVQKPKAFTGPSP